MLEQYEKAVDKKTAPETPAWQPTLKDILKDKEKSSYFGKMLERDGDQDIAERLAKGELTEGDIDLLEERRTTFSEVMKQVEDVNKTITKDMVESLALNDPEFEKILKLVGPESAVQIYKKQMMEFSIADQDYFQSVFAASEDLTRYQTGDWKNLDQEIVDLCKKKNIKPEEYIKALAIEDPDDRAKALRGTVREGYGWFQKASDWLSQGAWSSKRVDLIGSKKDDIDSALTTLKTHKKGVGEMLALAADKTPDIRKALSQELIGDPITIQPKEGFGEMKSTVPTPEALQTTWKTYKQDVIKNWDTLNAVDQDIRRDQFLAAQNAEYKKKNEKKAGFWSSIFKSFFDTLISSSKPQLK